ncbi:MAG TPA: 4Fe-4S binding protein [Hyphomicrobium sp.]|nr:4Fe-4S binding protein [Hyphomicrobium sp.]
MLRRAKTAGGWKLLLRSIIMACVLPFACSVAVFAAGFGAYRADVKPADVFAGADSFGPLEGTPPAIAAYKGSAVAGYVFETTDIGYSGKPIRILAGIDLKGTITGAKVIEHHEPILLVGISPEKLFDFVARHAGRNIIDVSKEASSKQVDVISGATVTAVVINDGIMRSAMAVAKSRGLAGFPAPGARSAAAAETPSGPAAVAEIPFVKADWTTMLGDGSIRRLHLTNRAVDEAFAKIGVGSPEPYGRSGVPDEDFIDLYVGLFSIETIGRSLVEDKDYAALSGWLKPGQSALVLASNGDYSFRGSGFVRGGIFDRIQVVQDDQTILFKDKDYRRLDKFADPNPEFKEIGLFRIPQKSKFDPTRSFRIELLAQRPTGAIQKAFTSYSLSYQLPARFIAQPPAQAPAPAPAVAATQPDSGSSSAAPAVAPAQPAAEPGTAEPAPEPLWLKIWNARALDVAILAISLAILTLIFFFQDWLVQDRVLFTRLRIGFLLFSVLWLGLYAKAQLSVVNVLTFSHAVFTGFRWEQFLLEPLIFILWSATAVSLLFWGRGAYCGWLCPFGSLQELLNHAARKLRIRQITVPFYLHERMWALKYVLFFVILGVSLGDMASAEQLAEVEPFKTVVLLRFMREWWFVIFALALLMAGLFIERFYCRYLCVLGAALAIPGRGRMFDWLKRRKQCGFECQLCARQCTVGAIHPLGQINPNECIYCMHCQVVYWDDHECPPLIMKREGRGKKRPAARDSGATVGTPPAKPQTTFTLTVKSEETTHG